jgi:hypothetical protein
VDFIGHLAFAQSKDASQLGGGPALRKQGVYVVVSVGDLKLH